VTVAPLDAVPRRSTVPKPVDRDEWLAVRRPYFNASAAAILYDRHPYQSPGDYATVKLSGEEQAPTRAMDRGRRMEDVIARWWADDHHVEVVESDVLFVADCIMATVDRIVIGSDGTPLSPLEIKSTNHRTAEPEPYWLDQCQAIMLTTDAPYIELVWLDSSLDIHEATVQADHAMQADMLRRAERFMAAIELGIVPDWISLSYDNVVRLYPEPAGGEEIGDDGLDLVRELAAVRQVRLDAEKDEKRLRDRLADLLGEKEAGLWNGIEILSFRAAKGATVFDRAMFAADHPDLAEKYMVTKPGTRRMLTKLYVGSDQ